MDNKELCRTKENRSKKAKCFQVGIPVVATLFAVLALYSFLPPIYYANDDAMLRDLLSGAFTGSPSNKTVYLNQPLASLLCLLYQVLPALPWFDLFQIAVLVSSFMLLLGKAVALCKKEKEVAWVTVLFLLVFVFLYAPILILPTYTVTAAVAGATGILLLFLQKREPAESVTKRLILPIIYLVLCYWLRGQVFYMMLPFWGLAGLYLLLQEKDKLAWKKYVPGILIFAGIILFSMLFGKLVYWNDDWKSYEAYNLVRTELYDYKGVSMREDELAQYEAHGFSAETMKLYASYNYLLAKEKDLSALEEILSLQPEHSLSLRELAYVYVDRLLRQTTDFPYSLLVLLLYLLLALDFRKQQKWKHLLCLLAAGIVRTGLWCYLIYRGRCPARVTISLYLCELALLAGIFVFEQSKQRKNRIGCALVILALLFGGTYSLKPSYEEYQKQKSSIDQYDMVYCYMNAHPDWLFILDANSFAPIGQPVFSGQSYGYSNRLYASGWMAHSPLYKEKLMQYGTADLREALLACDKVYFIGKDYSCLPEEKPYRIVETINAEAGQFYVITYQP